MAPKDLDPLVHLLPHTLGWLGMGTAKTETSRAGSFGMRL